MSKIKPIRIQRKRTRGFNLQAESLSRNGLSCVYVGRPSRWGNPYLYGKSEIERDQIIKAYKVWLEFKLAEDPDFLEPLKGKNLACFCRELDECHADVLLELANEFPIPWGQVVIAVNRLLFEFASFTHWVNKADALYAPYKPISQALICVDAVGRVCTSGYEFERARDEQTFPVRVFLTTDRYDVL